MGTVEMANGDDAAEAIRSLHDSTLDGRQILVRARSLLYRFYGSTCLFYVH